MASIRRETVILLLGDLAILVFSLWLALTLRALHAPSYEGFLTNFTAFIPIYCISFFVFFVAGLYEKQTRLVRRVMGSRILAAQLANTIIAAIIFFLLPLTIAPKTILALYLIISVLLIQAWHFYITPRFSVYGRKPAVLVGHGSALKEVLEEVNENNKYSIFFSEQLDVRELDIKTISERIKAAVQKGATTIILDINDSNIKGELSALYDAMLLGVTFIDFASFYEDLFDRVPLGHIDYEWLLSCLPKRHVLYDIAKRAFDVIGSLIGMIIAAPFVVIAAIILNAQGGQPFIFHERVGRGGKLFRIVKLRTMLFNDHGDPERQKKNRVTTIGKLLRKSRIDELPQLFNIFIGHLSFIGPRPELPTIAAVYQKEIPYYEIRHLITPGLSGWAQLKDYDAPRGGADVERTSRKLSYDLYYLKHRSFGLDLVIAIKTIRALASFSGK